ncbi:hypothetical protein DL766_000234 [Monosporascus sp. MC13-8B]|uniref:Uncharacterized protein n=1 Tax=Monosporascus cannonballus TaxID=155416 RepID=A0ABY0H5V1_9PEZI|nr:hypothetical protein DL762_005514 [Monosporascus cannonballus]RYO93098.1 hypothetical protein DL763_004494 [Monosporascus cannonballus]RYP39792.1 hypothetical protein DL766_000234 [Monosporascus sp. MC13-8B]
MARFKLFGKRKEPKPAEEQSNLAAKDSFRESPSAGLQNTTEALPTPPKTGSEPFRAAVEDAPKDTPREYAPKDQQTEQKLGLRPLPSIPRKGLPTRGYSPLSVQKPLPLSETVKSSGPLLLSPGTPQKESENSVVQGPTGATRERQLDAQPTYALANDEAKGLRQLAAGSSVAQEPSPGPVGVRPARSQADLRSATMSSSHNRSQQNTTNKQTLPAMGASQSSGVADSVQRTAPTPSPLHPASTTIAPASPSAPVQKPELFGLVTTMNDAAPPRKDTVPDSTDRPSGSRPMPAFHPQPLGDIQEMPKEFLEEPNAGPQDEETQEFSKELNGALSRFPREFTRGRPAATVWPARPLCQRNYSCYTGHKIMIPARNNHYPLACQTCGCEDTSWRKVCSWCCLRVCYKCSSLLVEEGGNLEQMMTVLKANKRLEKGKDKEGDASPGT